MKTFFHRHYKWLLINSGIWSVSKMLFFAIKIWGIENTAFQSIAVAIWPMFAVVAITGMIDGIVFGMIDILIDTKFKTLRFSRRVIYKTLLNFVFGLTLTIVLAPVIIQWITGRHINLLDREIYSAQAIVLGIYFLFVTIVVQFLKLTLSWMKTQDIFEVIAHPYGIEESRIFLFLDMKSSTSMAEHLEASKYSRMLQESFIDMSETAAMTTGEIYQYVGDEAVLTWPAVGENFVNAIRFYFSFKEKLRTRSEHYVQEFGFQPEFKAGIHYGSVVKTQVGLTRKEIAFHGDPINTASRIQSKCSEISRELLISETFRDQIAEIFNCSWEGKFPIRGKTHEMNLFSVHESDFEAHLRVAQSNKFERADLSFFKASLFAILHWRPGL